MKNYELFLHYKQGDDFNSHLEDSKNPSEAFANWAKDFEQRKETCKLLSDTLKGVNVEVFADTHMISIVPNDREATMILDKLVAQETLTTFEFEDDECDCDEEISGESYDLDEEE